MDQKRIITPFILAGLFAVFGLVCFILWLKKGRPEKWVSRKMKLGAAIIAVTGLTTGCPPVVTCYDPMPVNWFEFDRIDQSDYSVIAKLPADSVLSGKVYEPTFDRYIFKIQSDSLQIVDRGEIRAVDGEFDQTVEDFKLTLDSAIDTGNYVLRVYEGGRNSEEDLSEVFQIKLKISK